MSGYLGGHVSVALITDLYQLTMAYGYWKTKRHEQPSVFHLSFRTNPFRGGYAITAGLAPVLEALEGFRFSADDIEYLRTLRGNDHQPLFESEFLAYLTDLALSCDIDAIPEGTVVFPHEPLLRVEGPLLQCQILETFLLNGINFPTLIATGASRVCHAAEGDTVLEFGLRRAQGIDGAMTASRAAYIGGCDATSNVLAGKRYDIPIKGTHAHSWVMAFEDERESFQAYANAMPNNCIFLVDTYDSLNGVRNAISVAIELRNQGHEMIGIRLDSGDILSLSKQARVMLDEAGFSEAKIVASNDLDEHEIERLKRAGAEVDIWGVGTRLVTAYAQPALDGIYKLSAIGDSTGRWLDRLKLSEQPVKVSNPGIQQVRRFTSQGQAKADVIYDNRDVMGDTPRMMPFLCDPTASLRTVQCDGNWEYEDLLIPVLRQGRRVGTSPSLHQIRDRAATQLQMFSPDIRRLVDPLVYPTGLDPKLFAVKKKLVEAAPLQKTPG
ncbi:Nicotinate phosphoribosyltransferase pncB2 [Novipirellula galeiformis]|uniref:Nicotinate phosphoribosyltransferase n=1 Tax=Novipirellula galeiformis TaxID=2528004 RepID=A0A5C6CH28_9BACT|nr:nicotinate phosphoribosyltransferase [Novipirellula galeiformis]TWU22536.1 Nicotinate phosphoribosyltransferase pncB2 [Novipirellula galeiformis]